LTETLHRATRGDRPARATARPRHRRGAAVAGCLVLLVAVVLAGCGSSGGSKTSAGDAVAVTPAGLKTLARQLKQPIYWIGPGSNVTYEQTTTGTGRVLVRYLPADAKIGTSTPYPTVGTYTVQGAYAASQRAASTPDAVRIKVASSAIAFSTKSHPLNAWITYPGSRYQIEVFDPTPGRARKLVASGKVVRVPGSPRESRPVQVSPKSLARVAATAQTPIYWGGPRPQQTYELTRTSQGGFLVRYLPLGTDIGVTTPYLTVGTYAVKNALAAIRRLSLVKGSTQIKLDGGGLAVTDPHFPRSVYLAYPGSAYEIEVFDPSIAQARQLVTSGQIVAVH
jgi:hypothetical protein